MEILAKARIYQPEVLEAREKLSASELLKSKGLGRSEAAEQLANTALFASDDHLKFKALSTALRIHSLDRDEATLAPVININIQGAGETTSLTSILTPRPRLSEREIF
jgi:hypothetical protein